MVSCYQMGKERHKEGKSSRDNVKVKEEVGRGELHRPKTQGWEEEDMLGEGKEGWSALKIC